MFRIETTKSRVIEFQQSLAGPDYDSLCRLSVEHSRNDPKTHALRFKPEAIVHARLPNVHFLRGFEPYGVSLLEYFDKKSGVNIKDSKDILAHILRQALLCGLQEVGMRHLAMRGYDTKFTLV